MDKPPGIVTPCCGTRLIIILSTGSGYTAPDYVEEIICDGEGCNNSWSATGEASEWNK